MKDILKRLEGSAGVMGALVMTLDGVVVATLDGTPYPDETAAYISTIFLAIEEDSDALEFTPVKRITMWATDGRLIVLPYDDFALVVVADQNTDLSYSLLEVAGTARGIMKRSKIQLD